METYYSYEHVKNAYKAIIEVGRARVIGLFGPLSAQVQHRKNLKHSTEPQKNFTKNY